MLDETVLNISLCPITSLPSLIENGTIPGLRDGFSFDSEVKPRWISYDPNQVTLLSCNEMFEPLYALPSICNNKEQTLKVKSEQGLEELRALFEKPIFLCVTRRQEDEAMITGFDTDFVIALDPRRDALVARALSKMINFATVKIQERKKFFLRIDFGEKLQELSPPTLRQHVMWLNASFVITNYSKPSALMYLNIPYLWCMLLPCCVFVALPYRLWRRLRSDDRIISLRVRPSLLSVSSVPLVLHFFYTLPERPLPGRYSKCQKLYGYNACPASELKSLLLLPTGKQRN